MGIDHRAYHNYSNNIDLDLPISLLSEGKYAYAINYPQITNSISVEQKINVQKHLDEIITKNGVANHLHRSENLTTPMPKTSLLVTDYLADAVLYNNNLTFYELTGASKKYNFHAHNLFDNQTVYWLKPSYLMDTIEFHNDTQRYHRYSMEIGGSDDDSWQV